MTPIELSDDPGNPQNDQHRWTTAVNTLAGTFARGPDDPAPASWQYVLRPEIAAWLRERNAIYRLYRERIKTPSWDYTGYFIAIEDDTIAVEFRLRWFG